MKNILNYEWIIFRRDRFAVIVCLLMLMVGLYAIYYGKSFHAAHINTLTTIDTAYQNRVQKQLQSFNADTSSKEGKKLHETAADPFMSEYSLRPVVFKEATPLQALSIGQSDNQPFFNELWLYNDHVYTSAKQELRNPNKLLAGNFDLSFVYIFLFPLLIIAYSYGVFSSDRENGITTLLLAQGIPVQKIIVGKLLFRLIITGAMVAVLSLVAAGINSIPFNIEFLLWLLTNLLYIVMWFSIVYAVVSLKKSTSITALMLVGIWISFLILIPSLINDMRKSENVERVDLSDAEREYGAHIWHLWKNKPDNLRDTLLSVVPDWKQFSGAKAETINSVAYSYLDMLHVNRIGWQIDSAAAQEQRRLDGFSYINPAYAAQQALNTLARTELYDYVDYRYKASMYQKKRSEAVNGLRLADKTFTAEDSKQLPVWRDQPEGNIIVTWLKLLIPLVLLSVLSLIAGSWINKLA